MSDILYRGVHKFTNRRRKQDPSDVSVQLSSFPTSFGLVLKNDPPKPLDMAAAASVPVPKKFHQRVSEQHKSSYSQICLISHSGDCFISVTFGLLSSLDIWMHSFQHWTLSLLQNNIPSGLSGLHCVSLGTLCVFGYIACVCCVSFNQWSIFQRSSVGWIIPFQNFNNLHRRVKQLKPKFSTPGIILNRWGVKLS